MTGEEFLKLYRGCPELRQYIVDVSKAFSKNMEIQQDLIQEAWIRVSLSDSGKTIQYYKKKAFDGINNSYYKEWRGWRLIRWGKEHRTIAQRVRRIENKRL